MTVHLIYIFGVVNTLLALSLVKTRIIGFWVSEREKSDNAEGARVYDILCSTSDDARHPAMRNGVPKHNGNNQTAGAGEAERTHAGKHLHVEISRTKIQVSFSLRQVPESGRAGRGRREGERTEGKQGRRERRCGRRKSKEKGREQEGRINHVFCSI